MENHQRRYDNSQYRPNRLAKNLGGIHLSSTALSTGSLDRDHRAARGPARDLSQVELAVRQALDQIDDDQELISWARAVLEPHLRRYSPQVEVVGVAPLSNETLFIFTPEAHRPNMAVQPVTV